MPNTNKTDAASTYFICLRAALAMGFNRDVATYYASQRHAGVPALDAYLRL
jgi:hypothetical protein